ncbi:hypothetical protein ACNAN0_12215 [Agrilactobacillus fermenti]|uniref:hypothetical protein n=1 Tax=Agrilactobacillus fermenti TaxID=2586909 RepID=UPI003A5C74FE
MGACTTQKESTNQKAKPTTSMHRTNQYQNTLAIAKKHQKIQQDNLNKLPKQTYKSEASYAFGRDSYQDMVHKTTATIQGVITNWTNVPAAQNMPVTILSVYVHQEFTGKASDLVGKTIYVYHQGGIIARDNLLAGELDKLGSQKLSPTQLQELVLSQKEGFEVPVVGTEVVFNLNKIPKGALPKAAEIVDQSLSYAFGWDEQSSWIKQADGKYVMSGQSDKPSSNNGNSSDTLQNQSSECNVNKQITAEINQKVLNH